MNTILGTSASEIGTVIVHQGRLAYAIIAGLAASLVLVLSACTGGGDEKGEAAQKGPTSSISAVTSSSAKIVPTSATASSSLPEYLPKFTFDGDVTTVWNAGAFAPAWIQLDLGQPMTISKVRLNVAQDPPGPTTHEITGGPTPDSLTLIGILDPNTTDGQWLELNQTANNVRYVKIATTKSPSFVAWREIEIYK
jgi:F5/8 type C domain-containing protein